MEFTSVERKISLRNELIDNCRKQMSGSFLWRHFSDGSEDFSVRGQCYQVIARAFRFTDCNSGRSIFLSWNHSECAVAGTDISKADDEDAMVSLSYLLFDCRGEQKETSPLRFALHAGGTKENELATSLDTNSEFEAHFLLPSPSGRPFAYAMACHTGDQSFSGLVGSSDDDFIKLVRAKVVSIHV